MKNRVILRRVHDEGGSRHLEAAITDEGDLLIEGHDYGDGVERIFGVREYEWVWTVPAANLPDLLCALNATGNVLAALQARFSDDDAAGLASFLESHGVPHTRWSRLGE